LVQAPLASRGLTVDTIPWDRAGVDWKPYGLVVIRSTWDYQHRPEAFLATLAAIEASGARLENSLAIARWNMQKTYLKDLKARAVTTVPTLWRDRLRPGGLLQMFEALESDEAVMKPVVSGNAQGAYWLNRARVLALAPEIEDYFAKRPLMMQPFERNVVTEGEFALIYFNGRHSHSILKVPKRGDFRVQEEHGADIKTIHAEPALLAAADAAMAAIGKTLLYARVDLVRHGAEFRVMELELVEPSLYLRMEAGAPERFADAIASLVA
ncbi:MAG: ATP-grasp domain-containing protein, partial [Burkholderiales bacterium]